MKKQTAKTIEAALFWMETQRHHKVFLSEEGNYKQSTHMILQGHSCQLRIPKEISAEIMKRRLTEPTPDPFDSRVYRATKKGRALLRKAGRMDEIKRIQQKRTESWWH